MFLFGNISCKKQTENQPPVIEIVSPSEGQSFSIDDEISVLMKAQDDVNIQSIKAGINDENGAAVTQFQSITVNQKSVEKTWRFKLNIGNIKAGKCFCYATVNDGEKQKTVYREIYVNETAKTFTGLITFEQNGITTKLHHYNSELQKQGVYNSNTLLNEAYFYAPSQILLTYTAGANAFAYQLPQFSVAWNLNSQVKSIASGDKKIFLIKADDYISAYNLPDLSSFRSYYENTFSYHPELAASGSELFCSFNKMSNQTVAKKIVVYDLNTSVLLKEYLLNEEAKAMINLIGNKFALLLKSLDNQFSIAVYDAQANQLNTMYTSSINLKSIARLNENLLLLWSDTGLGTFNLLNNTFQLIVSNSAISSFDFDMVGNQIYVISGNQLQKYNLNGTQLSSITFDHQPYDLSLTYNR
jgi:hypothetical protein